MSKYSKSAKSALFLLWVYGETFETLLKALCHARRRLLRDELYKNHNGQSRNALKLQKIGMCQISHKHVKMLSETCKLTHRLFIPSRHAMNMTVHSLFFVIYLVERQTIDNPTSL